MDNFVETQAFDELLNQKIDSELNAYFTHYGILLDSQIEVIADQILENIQAENHTDKILPEKRIVQYIQNYLQEKTLKKSIDTSHATLICYVDAQALDRIWIKFRFKNTEMPMSIIPSDIATLLNFKIDIDKSTFYSIFDLFSDIISSFKGVSILENPDASPSVFAIEIGQEEEFTCDQCGKVYPTLTSHDNHKYCKSCLENVQKLQSSDGEKQSVKMKVSKSKIPPAILKKLEKAGISVSEPDTDEPHNVYGQYTERNLLAFPKQLKQAFTELKCAEENLSALQSRLENAFTVFHALEALKRDIEKVNTNLDQKQFCINLANRYIKEATPVNHAIDLGWHDTMIDFLYELKQAESEKLFNTPAIKTQDTRLKEAEQLFLRCKFDEAFKKFEILANEGNGRAMYFLGEFYAQPYGNIQQNPEQGAFWHKKGKEKGDILATLNVAYTLPEDSEERYKIFNLTFRGIFQLAKSGDIFAQSELADMYLYGYGASKNDSKGMQWLLASAEQGYWQAQNKLGNIYYNQAENKPNKFIYNEEGVNENYEEAIKWYRKAAEQGYAIAQNNLANCYYQGHIMYYSSYDYTSAAKWYRKAAEQGYAIAQNNLGNCYYFGNGVEQNYSVAVKWYRKAAEQGNADAQTNLGVRYGQGEGVEQDFRSAVEWCKKAAEQGDEQALKNIGIMYYNSGEYEMAVKWIRQSAEQGNAFMQNRLGLCYYNGQGVEQNYAEAVHWFQKAAEQGDDWGQNNLGSCYHNGLGVNQDYHEAAKWYMKAASQGNSDALSQLKEIISLI